MHKQTVAVPILLGILLGAGFFTPARAEAGPEHPGLSWSVKLSPDGHYIDLVHAGRVWVKFVGS